MRAGLAKAVAGSHKKLSQVTSLKEEEESVWEEGRLLLGDPSRN